MGHGGVAASRGDGDLYKMLGGRDSAASGPASRYSKADSLGRGRDLANVSDFSTSADMKMDSVDAKQGSSSNSNSEDDEDGSGESDLAQSSDFATGGRCTPLRFLWPIFQAWPARQSKSGHGKLLFRRIQ